MIKKVISFALTDPLIKELNLLSKKTGLSKSDLARRAIEEYLKEHKDE